MWFIQQVPAHQPAVTSVYLQCIEGPNAHRSVCKARAKSLCKELRSELAEGPWVALARAGLVAVSPASPTQKAINDFAVLAPSNRFRFIWRKMLCSVGNNQEKRLRAKRPTRKNHSSASLACYAQTSARKARQVSTSALIKMLIICAAMLAIQLLAYFALQPVPH
jgi:hypothetical protein